MELRLLLAERPDPARQAPSVTVKASWPSEATWPSACGRKLKQESFFPEVRSASWLRP
jgi:hypothetical protein